MVDEGNPSALRLASQRLFTATYDGLSMMCAWCGRICSKFIKSNADFISATSVMVLFSVLGTILAAYIGYNISLEFAFLWDAIGSLFRGARSLLEMQALHPYKQYAELAYSAASDAVSHFIETDSVTTKTRDLYNYIDMVVVGLGLGIIIFYHLGIGLGEGWIHAYIGSSQRVLVMRRDDI